MNSLPALTRLCHATRRSTSRALRWTSVALPLAAAAFTALPVHAQTPLADQPVFASNSVPGNLALLLSVEFPTAVSVAHTNRTYASTNEYLGYFDPNKCYDYYSTNGTDANNYFQPAATASNRTCSSKWSGNFLNWASMQTIDPFRWALTGGYRVIDDVGLTVIEKAWATGQGGTGNFPDGSLSSAEIAGATPFPATTPNFYMRIQGLGNKMRFTATQAISFTGKYYNSTNQSGGAVLTRTDTSINFDWNTASASGAVNRTNMSARWTGNVTAPVAGSYIFRIRGDDNVKLTINSTVVVNQTNSNGSQNYTSPTYNATAGQVFSVRVDYVQYSGNSSVVLEWLTPGATDYVVTGPPLYANTATAFTTNSTLIPGAAYEVFMRAKVCDPSFLETNCKAYGTKYKPEGLMQKYSSKIRYSAFGYLNDSDKLRDGGVLRARQKFVGPTQPRPGSTPIVNPNREWDATTGQFTLNPDATDAANTAAIMGLPSGTTVTNSGVVNYLNKFGEVTPGAYKKYDNVSELYYAAIRYFKNQGSVPEWTNVPTGTADATRITWTDGFPVILTSPTTASDDPILYSCQRNFILGLGDVNTHADKNVPGNTTMTANEPAVPALVSGDATVNAVDATNKVGVLEGLGATLGTTNPYGGCCTNNSALMAGLAYDSHIKDIRPNDFLPQSGQTKTPITIDTYWVDVQEYQTYKNQNQFYLATKYGGFTVPAGYDPNNTTALLDSAWHTNTDTFGADKRPDNYFSGGRPDLMKAGLDAAFSKIASSIDAYTTSFSTSLPQVALTGNSSFSSKYEAKTWTGEVVASILSFDATTGAPSLAEQWKFTDKLAAQLAGAGWDSGRRVVSWNGTVGVAFRSSGTSMLGSAELAALDTSYVAADDRNNYLNYLRGDRTNEVSSTATGSTKAYRDRAKLIGDIVGSKARPIGTPSYPFSDAFNPGYSAFKTTWATRRTMVYVAANDGMMHAINGALVTSQPSPTPVPPLEQDADAGKEMFAYVPRMTFQGPNSTPNTDGLASLGRPAFVHHYLVNSTPNAYDIDFARTPDAAGAAQTPAATVSDWRTVLIGGMGKGGRGYYAIDVTDPQGMTTGGEAAVAGKVLWEVTDSTLGFTFGEPVVVKTKKYGWVLIFPSGYNNTDGKGYFVFVNPRTGAVLERVSTGIGSTTSSAGLAHANAFIVDASDGTADSVYGGDLLGNLWRLDLTALTGNYPAPVKLAELTDASATPAAQPVTSRPSIEVHPITKKRFVMVGTGRLLDETDISSAQGQTFYTIADGTNAAFNPNGLPLSLPYTRAVMANNTNPLCGTSADPTPLPHPTCVTFDPTTQAGWYEEMGLDVDTPAVPASGSTPAVPAHTGTGIAWRVISDSTTLSGSVAFPSILPSSSVCSASGDSRVYGRDYATGGTTVLTDGVPTSYVSLSGSVTDLRYVSVAGKASLISGTDLGKVSKVEIKPLSSLSLRRLNWRELQVVE
jgi:type IV pilus assembly protein PilY1